MSSITGYWTKLAQNDELKRSSLCASVAGSCVYIFGGELEPRKPRDNKVYRVAVKHGAFRPPTARADDPSDVNITATTEPLPCPRVGAASTSLNGKVYLFSGRGGEAMAPIEEKGHIWEFQPATERWKSIAPVSRAFPEARSYHCMTNNGSGTIYVHAGCPEKGRLADLWSFDVPEAIWKQLAPAPAPPRGGPSMTFVDGNIYRMHGFDGQAEQGGSLDVYDIATNKWTSHAFEADGKSGPGARSVSALVPITINGAVCLITSFGESDPSSLGHYGAGKMLGDVWAFSLVDQVWHKVETHPTNIPQPRGWFDADAVNVGGTDGVVVVGGLDDSNERLADAWLLTF
ncbi:hypothetical protein LTR86_003252 [Recurvomyces mirabilis]|nr:hypothetical protein LTR86_003252 [Recurvomyces mirabilis]